MHLKSLAYLLRRGTTLSLHGEVAPENPTEVMWGMAPIAPETGITMNDLTLACFGLAECVKAPPEGSPRLYTGILEHQ